MKHRPGRRVPARLHWFVLGTEVFVFLLGAAVTASNVREGKPLSRPGAIAFVAGAVGVVASLVATFVAPRIRERRARTPGP